ncbi:MAG: Lrp/AsnC ligand binding domain-containing protein [Candidatus Bathyarchaeota archaeon]|nr:Lrp/AsnC ligand binding domain-containing protein [Candidatus Bathyarchaeota archaeon]
MVSAVLLVNTDLGDQAKILERLKRVEGVEEAHAVYSVYNLALKVKATSVDKLKEIITLSIWGLSGVYTITTLMLVE